MNFITKEELEKKDIISKFSINSGNLVLSEDCEYKSTFDVGDIVTYKDNTDRIGVIYFIEDDEFSINWNNGTESTETSSNLVVVPPTIGLELLNNSDILNLWENLSNGKNESFDLKCIYLDNKVVNEVHFIKAFKNTNSIIDKKQFREELLRTKQRGYALDDMEHEFGIKCIAMPVFDRTKNVYAAISISGMANHFTDANIAEWAMLLKKYIRKIESRL